MPKPHTIKKVIVYTLFILLLLGLAYYFMQQSAGPDNAVGAFTHHNCVVINHTNYTSYFSAEEHIPLVVTFKLTADMVQCASEQHIRRGKFSEDPEQPDLTNLNNDYKKSGYDRGHNMSAADNECDEQGMRECFYFSNMTPQPHSFNAGKWEDLEKQERTEAVEYGQLIVTVGSIGTQTQIGTNQVVVPKFMWKVIYIPNTHSYQCYLFPDAEDVTDGLKQYEVPLPTIEKDASVQFTDGVVKVL